MVEQRGDSDRFIAVSGRADGASLSENKGIRNVSWLLYIIYRTMILFMYTAHVHVTIHRAVSRMYIK